jgi:hypothetical protein
VLLNQNTQVVIVPSIVRLNALWIVPPTRAHYDAEVWLKGTALRQGTLSIQRGENKGAPQLLVLSCQCGEPDLTRRDAASLRSTAGPGPHTYSRYPRSHQLTGQCSIGNSHRLGRLALWPFARHLQMLADLLRKWHASSRRQQFFVRDLQKIFV